jgi:4-hydroxy-tetrahydrodipicolinate synthase
VSTITWPKGLLTALVTPLRDDALNIDALAQLVELQIHAGVSGLVVGGGTGEFGTLSLSERRQLAEELIRLVAGRVPVMVQTGALATRDAIALSQHAQEAGAFGLLLASPFGEPINWRERFTYYEQVNASVDLPIMVYNTPPAGVLTFNEIQQLATLSNVSAIKDTSGDPGLLGDLLTTPGQDLQVYVGMDTLLFDAISSGASGAIFGAPNFIPDVLTRMIELVRTSQGEAKTTELWRELRSFLRFMEISPNYMSLCKAGCALEGIDVGDVRPPYLKTSEAEKEELAQRLSKLRATLGHATFAR